MAPVKESHGKPALRPFPWDSFLDGASLPYLAAVAGMVHHQDLWQLCRDELIGVDVRAGGWDIRGRWFGKDGALVITETDQVRRPLDRISLPTLCGPRSRRMGCVLRTERLVLAHSLAMPGTEACLNCNCILAGLAACGCDT
jgi:hypothetical protein